MCAYFSKLLKTLFVVRIFRSHFGSFFCATIYYTFIYILFFTYKIYTNAYVSEECVFIISLYSKGA